MGKNKNKSGGFNNYAARKFADANKVPKMSQHKIMGILESDMAIMIDQVAKNRAGEKDAKYPQYITNGFANLSTAKLFYDYIKTNVKINKKDGSINTKKTDMTFSEVDALRVIIANAMSASLTGQFPNESPDYAERNEYLAKSFQRLDPVRYKMTKKLKLDSNMTRRKLIISVFLDPRFEAKRVMNIFDKSGIPDKKKMKLLMKLYRLTEDELSIKEIKDDHLGLDDDPNYVPGEMSRFAEAIGYIFTLESANSDFAEMCIRYVSKRKKRDRKVFLMEFAEAFKVRKTSNFLLKSGDFYDKNRKIMKKLVKMDVGYRKAFRSLNPTDGSVKNKGRVTNSPSIMNKRNM